MLLAINQMRFKVLAVVAALALVMPMVMMPVGAAHAQEKCFCERVKYLDVEIKVIDGQPMFVYETEKGYEKTPFSMSDLGSYAYANGQKVPLQTQGNSILVPTEEGLVPVPIEEFDVVMVDGQIALLAEVNAAWVVPVGMTIFAATQLAKVGIAYYYDAHLLTVYRKMHELAYGK
ncbi:hypothetical protein M1N80_04320 [Peptococcaceae bacterium]|nr:hypothetical protein [Peptococcaceae bacterium]